MKPPRNASMLVSVLVGLAVLGAACGDDESKKPILEPVDNPPAVVADFHLADRNSNSPTFEAVISPRDYLGKVSCYYFTSAT